MLQASRQKQSILQCQHSTCSGFLRQCSHLQTSAYPSRTAAAVALKHKCQWPATESKVSNARCVMQLLTPARQEQTALLMHCMCLQMIKLHWTGLLSQPYTLLLVGVRSSPMLLAQRKLPSRLWVFRVFWVSLTRQHGGVAAAGQHSS